MTDYANQPLFRCLICSGLIRISVRWALSPSSWSHVDQDDPDSDYDHVAVKGQSFSVLPTRPGPTDRRR